MSQSNPQTPMPPLNFWQGLRYSHDPRLVRFHFQQVKQVERLLMGLTDTDLDSVREAMFEIWRDEEFLRDFLGRQKAITGREPRGTDFMFLSYQAGSPYFHGLILYSLARLLKPAVVVETGGTPGNSSAFLLRAMDRNQCGELHTIDLPPTETLGDYAGHGGWLHEGMPEGQRSGWAVPDALRNRHRQHLGDAKDLLPNVMESVQRVDVFLHDSDHSYEHMAWEFATAWPYVVPGGCVLSDDIDANDAWMEFAAEHAVMPFRAGAMGALRKPR